MKALLILLLTSTLLCAGESSRPNYVFLLTDDQRYDDLGCTGNTVIRTPNIDALASRGVLFRNSFITSSICMASRASYFTGRVERSHACNFYYRNLSAESWAQSYPVLLRRAGYRTGFIGKFGVEVDGALKGLPTADFDRFDGFAGQGQYFPQGKPGPHLDRVMGDQAVGFLQGAAVADKPFCLSVSFKAPHVPLEPDPAFADLYREAEPFLPHGVPGTELAGLPPTYREAAWYARLEWQTWFSRAEKRREFIRQRYRLIAGVDAAVGRIVAELERLSLTRNTVIVFGSDNGYYYGEHGLTTKFYLHEESIHVPLIVVDPSLPAERRGRTIEQLTANIDIAPTLLERAGLTPPKVMQGRSLMPLLRGKTSGWRDAVFCENLAKERRPMCDAIRTAEWKYIAYFETNPLQEELYHLANDPQEARNLAGEPAHAKTKADLRAHLQTLREQLSESASGFPDWIQTQKEKTANWQGYRDQYLKRVGSPGAAESTQPTTTTHEVPQPMTADFPLWDEKQKLGAAKDLPVLDGVEFHVIKKWDKATDGYTFLHGVGLAWHKGKLYASIGHNKGDENTVTEEAQYRVSEDGGRTWGELRAIDTGEEDQLAVSHGVFLSHAGKLWAFHGAYYNKMQRIHTRAYSLDEATGQWVKHGVVIENGFWALNQPVKMSDGNWIMPGISAGAYSEKNTNPAAVAISHGDDFTKWDFVRIPAPQGIKMWGESSIIVEGANVLNIARYGAKPLALVAKSSDFGRTWTTMAESNLPMTTSKPCAGLLSNGQRYLICTTAANNGGRRSPLTIAVSKPGETLLSKVFVIRHGEFPAGGEPRANALSYPCATEHEGKLYVGYSNNGGRKGNHNSAEMAVIPIVNLRSEP